MDTTAFPEADSQRRALVVATADAIAGAEVRAYIAEAGFEGAETADRIEG